MYVTPQVGSGAGGHYQDQNLLTSPPGAPREDDREGRFNSRMGLAVEEGKQDSDKVRMSILTVIISYTSTFFYFNIRTVLMLGWFRT